MRSALLSTLLLLSACAPATPPPLAEGSAFGHFEVTVSSDQLEALEPHATWSVSVGGVAAYEVVKVDARTVRFTKLAAFGASLTMGSQDASISQRSPRRTSIHSPAARRCATSSPPSARARRRS